MDVHWQFDALPDIAVIISMDALYIMVFPTLAAFRKQAERAAKSRSPLCRVAIAGPCSFQRGIGAALRGDCFTFAGCR